MSDVCVSGGGVSAALCGSYRLPGAGRTAGGEDCVQGGTGLSSRGRHHCHLQCERGEATGRDLASHLSFCFDNLIWMVSKLSIYPDDKYLQWRFIIIVLIIMIMIIIMVTAITMMITMTVMIISVTTAGILGFIFTILIIMQYIIISVKVLNNDSMSICYSDTVGLRNCVCVSVCDRAYFPSHPG